MSSEPGATIRGELELEADLLRVCERIFTSATDLMAVVDDGLRLRLANRQFLDAFALNDDQAFGCPLDEFVGSLCVQQLHQSRTQRAPPEAVAELRELIEVPSLGRRYFQILHHPLLDRHRRVCGAILTFRDISDRPADQDEPPVGDRRFRELVETFRQGVVVYSNTKILFANEAFATMHGYASVSELLDQTEFSSLVAPHELPRLRSYEAARQRGYGAPSQFEYEALRRDGSRLILAAHARNIDWAGTPALQCLVIDLTEQRKAAAALERSEARYRSLVEGATQGMIVHRRWKPLFANDAFARLHGYECAADVYAMYSVLQLCAAADRPRLQQLESRQLDGGGVVDQTEYEGRRRDGESITLQMSARIVDWEGEPAVEATVVDITDRARAERLLTVQRSTLELVATGAPLDQMTEQVCREVELLVPNSVCTVMLIARNRLMLVAGPNVPARLHAYLSEHGMGLDNGLCGTAALTGEPVYLSSTYDEPMLFAMKPILEECGIRACWSIPIRSGQGTLLGTFAVGRLVQGNPSEYERRILEMAAHLAGIAIERHRVLAAVRIRERQYRALYDESPAMFLRVDEAGQIESVNDFGARSLGYAVDELAGRDAASLFEVDEQSTFRAWIAECFAGFGEVHGWEGCARRRNGSSLWVRVTGRVTEDDRSGRSLLLVCEDVTEARMLSEQLAYEVSHDALTGLVNRREFEHRLSRAIESARREGAEHALCYLDLDQFKVINDTCGHVAGDELLRQLGEELQHKVRRHDTLARLGGDEFGVLLENCSLDQATRIARKILEEISDKRFAWADRSFNVGASVGLVPISAESGTMTELLKEADSACYLAKDAGRNRIHLYSPNDDRLAHRKGEMHWASRITQALQEDRFALFWQPIRAVSSDEKECVRVELLLRMIEENGEIVSPGRFLPAAERYNLISRLDRWAVRSAFSWFATQGPRASELDYFALNLSGQSLGDEGFLEFIQQQLSEPGISGDCVCFEITETAAISNLTSARRFIGALKAIGCRFSLDDFGSGLSSFAYLKSLPVDYLKIDGAFVRDVVTDPVDLAMVRSINDMGHALGKRTVAEFVEGAAILRTLKDEVGVDYGQGYHFGRPRPLDELAQRSDQV